MPRPNIAPASPIRYLAEVAIELRDRKADRQIAEQGIRFAEKSAVLKPANAE